MVGQQLERGQEDENCKERRLDDFWQMTLIRSVPGVIVVVVVVDLMLIWLHRPGSEEVIRRAMYRIRRQQQVSSLALPRY